MREFRREYEFRSSPLDLCVLSSSGDNTALQTQSEIQTHTSLDSTGILQIKKENYLHSTFQNSSYIVHYVKTKNKRQMYNTTDQDPKILL